MTHTDTDALTAARGFASDNNATIHPDVLAAIARVNVGHAAGYGHDDYTQSVEARFAEHFGDEARTFFVFNGSGGNVTTLRAVCRPWQAVICTETAHLNTDECGAPEALAGVKALTAPGLAGKLTADAARRLIARVGDEHAVQPRVISISQSTELGTVYTPQETVALATLAHENGLLLHVDGARISNAAAALDTTFRALTTDAGVDLLTFGGTKNGLLGGEAVVVLRPELAQDFAYVRKQSLQLASKMRYIAAQFDALLDDDLWRRCAAHANAMAARLAHEVRGIRGVRITVPVEANAVFAVLPREVTPVLQQQFPFYVWNEHTGEVRWMCAWDTTEEDVENFVAAIRDAVGG